MSDQVLFCPQQTLTSATSVRICAGIEFDAQGGHRYAEQMRSRFAVMGWVVASLSLPAVAQVCTLNTTASFSIGSRSAPTAGQAANDYVPIIAFTTGAASTTCASTLQKGARYKYEHTANPDSFSEAASNDEHPMGTFELPSFGAASLSAQVISTCSCGLAGSNTITVNAGSIIVPPTIYSVGAFSLDPEVGDITIDAIPSGRPITLAPLVGAALCTGESMTLTLTGLGITKTLTSMGTEDCSGGDIGSPIEFTATSTGIMKLVAEFNGVKSNEVAVTVVNGGTSGPGEDNGSDSTDDDTSLKSVCSVAPEPLLLLLLPLWRRWHRRGVNQRVGERADTSASD